MLGLFKANSKGTIKNSIELSFGVFFVDFAFIRIFQLWFLLLTSSIFCELFTHRFNVQLFHWLYYAVKAEINSFLTSNVLLHIKTL